MPDNAVIFVGNVTRDPELRYTASGQANLRFSIAVNRRWQNRQTQEWEEQVSFFNCVAWGKLAENAGDGLKKGHRVIVEGLLEQRSYETDEGEKRSVVEVRVDDVGASFRFATVAITRNPSNGTGGGAPQGNEVPNQPDDGPFDGAGDDELDF